MELHEKKQNNLQKIIIVTGERGEGKTTFVKKIIDVLKDEGLETKGFLSLALFDDEIKIGYNLLNIPDNKVASFIRTNEFQGMVKFRKYYFSNEGIIWGNKILLSYKKNTSDILVIDEIGPLELEGGGWAESLNELVKLPQFKMIWIVRKEILEEVIKKWGLLNPVIIDVSQTTVDSAKEIILKMFSFSVQ